MLATKVWLSECMLGLSRPAQRHLARKLLGKACRLEDISITDTELASSGIELIELFATKYQLGLSIAHCSGMIAIALAPAVIGIDCEAKGRKRSWKGIAQQFFSAEEAQTITAASAEEREVIFLRHWVLKEAYIKANRGSLFPDLNTLVLAPEGFAHVIDAAKPRAWQCWEMEINGFPVAICTTATARPSLYLVAESTSEESGCAIQSISSSLAVPLRIELRKFIG